ncbi:MAG: restriction endonuclease subunit S, partial [Lewinellaceae bacterium]|nr:restriction endonuclease subunit S [Lewinellaceae bacterium]
MMERFRQYKEYKDSGLIWLGRVPIHWKPIKINNFTKIVSERNHPEEELLSVYRDYGVIKKESRDDNHNKPGENLSNYKLVKPDYLVLNKMKTWQGSLGISKYRGIVSPAYITCKLTKNNIYPPFLHNVLRCRNYVFEYNRISYGVRTDQWDMRYDEFKNIPVFFPNLEEQKAIATFLDHKTAQIAHYIQFKEKTIALLEERKAAIINQAVTRGLDADVKMKDSGIEWLGEVPEGWEVKKLWYLISYITSGSRGWGNYYSEKGAVFIRVGNISKNKDISLNLEDLIFVSPPSSSEGKRTLIVLNDVLLAITGATIGSVALIDKDLGEAYVNQHTALMRPIKEKINPKWLAYSLLSEYCQTQIRLKS